MKQRKKKYTIHWNKRSNVPKKFTVTFKESICLTGSGVYDFMKRWLNETNITGEPLKPLSQQLYPS